MTDEEPMFRNWASDPEVTKFLKENVREGDIVITMGAGDIYRAGEALLK